MLHMTTSPEQVHVALYDTLVDYEIGFATTGIRNPEFQRQPGRYELRFASAGGRPATTLGGMRVEADDAIEQLDPAGSAMLILAGNQIADRPEYTPFVDTARRFLDAGTPVAAICGATIALAAAGLLDERRHTSNAPMVLEAVGYGGGAHYVDDALAVTDGPLITASAVGPVEFAREIFATLDLYEPEVLSAWEQLYGDQDPAGYFALMAANGQDA